jgi:hypothetical protein
MGYKYDLVITSQEDCIVALRNAADELGHSPTIKEYKSLDTPISARTIIRKCDSWNHAKELAGLAVTH